MKSFLFSSLSKKHKKARKNIKYFNRPIDPLTLKLIFDEKKILTTISILKANIKSEVIPFNLTFFFNIRNKKTISIKNIFIFNIKLPAIIVIGTTKIKYLNKKFVSNFKDLTGAKLKL